MSREKEVVRSSMLAIKGVINKKRTLRQYKNCQSLRLSQEKEKHKKVFIAKLQDHEELGATFQFVLYFDK